MARNRKIDKMYIDLGMDMSGLDSDFITASNTVNEEMAKLGRMVKGVKLSTAIEISGLEGSGNEVDKLKLKLSGLNQELKIQSEKLKVLAAEHKAETLEYGENSIAVQKATVRLKAEQRVQSELAAEIKRTTTAIKAQEEAQKAAATQDKLNSINNKFQQSQLKTEIKILGIDEAVNSTEKLNQKLQGLQQQMNLQSQSTKVLRQEYISIARSQGLHSEAAEKLKLKLLESQKAEALFTNQIKISNKAIKEQTAAIKAQEEAQKAAATQKNLSSLSAKSEHAKLETEIKILGLDESKNGIEILKTKIAGLKSQMDIQKQTTAALSQEYKRVATAEGESSLAAMRLKTNLLQAEKAEAVLKSQLNATNMSLNQQTIAMSQTAVASNKLNFSSLKSGMQSAKGAIGGVTGVLGKANLAILAFTSTAATLGGLTAFTDSAVKAGDSAYSLKSKLNLSAAEAGNLNRMLGMVDVDAKTFSNTMVRLDKSVQTAGKNGNATTKALERFGVSLQDDDGKLKNYSEQLTELAKGYEAASAAGQEEAYVAEVLGNRGAELVPLLKEYNELATSSSKIKTIGIDADEAHQTALHMKELNMQAGQLKNALGNALMPVVNEFAPQLQEYLGEIAISIKEHKEDIKLISDLIINGICVGEKMAGFLLEVALSPLKGWHEIFKLITGDADYLSHTLEYISETLENYRRNGLVNVQNSDAFHEQLEAEKRLAEVEKKRIAQAEKLKQEQAKQAQERIEQLKKEEENTKAVDKVRADIAAEEFKRSHNNVENAIYDIEREKDESIKAGNDTTTALEIAEMKRIATIKKSAFDGYKLIKEARESAYAEDFKRDHSGINNELFDIEREKEKIIQATGDMAVATEVAEIKKQAAYRKSAAEIKQNRNELAESLYNITHSSLESRLNDIEKEKREWIKKTKDEVTATKLAEAQKKQATQAALVETLKNDQKQAEIVDKWRKNQISEETMMKELRKIELDKAGLKESDVKKYPKELLIETSKIMDGIRKNQYDVIAGEATTLKDLFGDLASGMKDVGSLAAENFFAPFHEQTQMITAQLASAGQMAVDGSRYQQQGGGSSGGTMVNLNLGGISVTIKNDIDRAKVIEEAERKVGRELKIILNEALSNL